MFGSVTVHADHKDKYTKYKTYIKLTAPVISSSPVKRTSGFLPEVCTSCGMVMKPKLTRKEMVLNMRSHFRKLKYDRTLVPKRPPISFMVPCHSRTACLADDKPTPHLRRD